MQGNAGASRPLELELKELLKRAQGAERLDIEFKSRLDMDTAARKAEFAKDVAIQANLPTGGNIVYGVNNMGAILGLAAPVSRDDLARVLANRLMFAPPGIEIACLRVPAPDENLVDIVWVRVSPNPFPIPTSFLDTDGTWKMPVRVDTVTRYLSPAEAIVHYRGRETERGALGPRFMPVSYDSAPDPIPETLDSNLFVFAQIPKNLWLGRTRADTEEEVRNRCGSPLPPFRLWNREIVCLREYDECEDAFAQTLLEPGRIVPTGRFLGPRDARRVVIGLLSAEVVDYACKLNLASAIAQQSADHESATPTRDSLLYDEDSGKVYFPPRDGQPWKLPWQSFKRQATRTVVGVVRRPDGTVHHWFHIAARLRVEDLGSAFALMIEPTWLFTKDGREVLRSYRIATVATRKMSLEDNARILYNIHFWAQILSRQTNFLQLPVGGGGARISKEPIRVRVKAGIRGDAVSVPEVPVDPELEIEDLIPEEVEEEGEDKTGE
jgi:hypothetical protein